MLQVKSFEFSPIRENTYILYKELNECLIIDPGCYYDRERDELLQFIIKMDLRPVMLLNTHCHLDHVFGNKFVAEQFNLPLHIHRNEKPVLDHAPAIGLMYDLPFDNYTGQIIYLEEGEELHYGENRLKVLLTPGHSPGSLAFYNEKDRYVISGDALFYRSIGRTDLPGGDHETLLKNIREKLFVLPDDTRVYSGHGPVTTIGEEKRLNPFLS
jgi:glyoxylase-like metal-dependent hydrolase (beta-lactamase superfamily II)